MRRLLLLLWVWVAVLAGLVPLRAAQAQAPEPPPASQAAGHGGLAEPPLVPSPRPALVAGEVVTPRFRLLYTARSERATRALAERIETVRDGFQLVLGRDWPGVTEVRVGSGRREMEALALPGGRPPGWAVALAYPAHNVILLDATTLLGGEGQDTLWHELSHVALGRLGTGWPRWFQEGLAIQLTGERFHVGRYTALFRAVRTERVFSFEHLGQGWPEAPHDVEVAYAQSAAFVGWLQERYGPVQMGQLVDFVRAGEAFETAFAKAFRTSLYVEEQDWRKELPKRYGWLPWATTSSLVMGAGGVLLVLGYLRRRRARDERLEEMAREDEAEEVARRLLEAEEAARVAAVEGVPAEAAVQVEVRAEGGGDLPEERGPLSPTLH